MQCQVPANTPYLPVRGQSLGLTLAPRSRSWFLVSKIDREELFAPLNHVRPLSLALAFCFVMLGGTLMFLWLRNQRTRYQLLKTQCDVAVEREMLTKRYEYLASYANDIILVTDVEGRVIEANARAIEAYGYSEEEFLQMDIRGLCDRQGFLRTAGGVAGGRG